ncbi:MAG: hypothetical protein JW700_02130 [Candidatus Aenigmarchaeota archaeon]|nr:hypothetical protein [Candidatus Aenigmarchaeota archaeon]
MSEDLTKNFKPLTGKEKIKTMINYASEMINGAQYIIDNFADAPKSTYKSFIKHFTETRNECDKILEEMA